MKIAIRVYWFLDTFVYSGMIGGCLVGLLVGWLMGWCGSAAACRGVLLDFAGKVRVEVMEYEVVSVKVPKGLVKEGMQLVIGVPRQTHSPIGSVHCPGVGACSVFLIPKLLKPDWKPPKIPKMRKGWLTYDERRGWARWDERPEYSLDCKWHSWKPFCGVCPVRDEVFDILNLPCCDGFDERECIWEVG